MNLFITGGNGFIGKRLSEVALKENFQRFAGNSDLSFAQLETLVANDPTRFKSLSVVASNLNQQRPQVFDAHNNPALPIWQAVRASMSIPLIF